MVCAVFVSEEAAEHPNETPDIRVIGQKQPTGPEQRHATAESLKDCLVVEMMQDSHSQDRIIGGGRLIEFADVPNTEVDVPNCGRGGPSASVIHGHRGNLYSDEFSDMGCDESLQASVTAAEAEDTVFVGQLAVDPDEISKFASNFDEEGRIEKGRSPMRVEMVVVRSFVHWFIFLSAVIECHDQIGF